MGAWPGQDFTSPGTEAVKPRQSPATSRVFKGILDISWPSPLSRTAVTCQRVPQSLERAHSFPVPQAPSCRLPADHHKSFPSSLPSFAPRLVLFSLFLTPPTRVLAQPSLGCLLVCKAQPLAPDKSQANPARPPQPCHAEGHVPQHVPCTVTALGQTEERTREWSWQAGHECPGAPRSHGAIAKLGSPLCVPIGSRPAESS